jgi:hypothetical protein
VTSQKPKGWHPGTTTVQALEIERSLFDKAVAAWNLEKTPESLRCAHEQWIAWKIALEEARTGRPFNWQAAAARSAREKAKRRRELESRRGSS